jgi:FkbM family methyltransferase
MSIDEPTSRPSQPLSFAAGDVVTKFWTTDWSIWEYAELTCNDHVLRFATEAPLLDAMVRSLLTREPTTPPWLLTFGADDIFVDIGANIGLYSIYAASMTGARVYAFEPESQNYAELNKNIVMNGLSERITAYCLALSDVEAVSELLLCTFAPGFGHHDFGGNSWNEDLRRDLIVYGRESRLRQGAVGMTLDALVDGGVFAVPQHLKIDVDGFEWKVLRGARRTLERPEVKTVLIETDLSSPKHLEMIRFMTANGWHYSEDQLRVFTHEVLPSGSIEELVRRGKPEQNVIYFRDCDVYRSLFAQCASSYRPATPP